jgi:hypothetical protein
VTGASDKGDKPVCVQLDISAETRDRLVRQQVRLAEHPLVPEELAQVAARSRAGETTPADEALLARFTSEIYSQARAVLANPTGSDANALATAREFVQIHDATVDAWRAAMNKSDDAASLAERLAKLVADGTDRALTPDTA